MELLAEENGRVGVRFPIRSTRCWKLNWLILTRAVVANGEKQGSKSFVGPTFSRLRRNFPGERSVDVLAHVCRRQRCGGRVQGRHPRQSSDAEGAVASQLGARAGAGHGIEQGIGAFVRENGGVFASGEALRSS